MHRVKRANADGGDLTKSDAAAIRAVEQNNEPEGTGNGLVPPVPFDWIVDELLSLAAGR